MRCGIRFCIVLDEGRRSQAVDRRIGGYKGVAKHGSTRLGGNKSEWQQILEIPQERGIESYDSTQELGYRTAFERIS